MDFLSYSASLLYMPFYMQDALALHRRQWDVTPQLKKVQHSVSSLSKALLYEGKQLKRRGVCCMGTMSAARASMRTS